MNRQDCITYGEWLDEVDGQLRERGYNSIEAKRLMDWQRTSTTLTSLYFEAESPCAAASQLLIDYDNSR